MHKRGVFALLLCFVLSITAVAMAADTHSTTGTVTGVSSADHTFTIKSANKNQIFYVSPSTKIKQGGKRIALVHIQAGDDVKVWYSIVADQNEASKVVVRRVLKG